MALADEVMDRYRSRKSGGGGGDTTTVVEDEGKSDAAIAAGKALLAAIRRGDAEAVCEAVKNIATEY